MTDAPQTFSFNGQDVRVAIIDGEAWFVAKDVCEAIGILSYPEVLKCLGEDEKRLGMFPDTDTIASLISPSLTRMLYSSSFSSALAGTRNCSPNGLIMKFCQICAVNVGLLTVSNPKYHALYSKKFLSFITWPEMTTRCSICREIYPLTRPKICCKITASSTKIN